MFCSLGQVNSSRLTEFVSTFITTISGLRGVTQIHGRMDPPPPAWWPRRSLKTLNNVLQDGVVSPCEGFCVQGNTSAVQNVVCGLAAPTQLTHVRWRFLPSLEIYSSLKCIYGCIE